MGASSNGVENNNHIVNNPNINNNNIIPENPQQLQNIDTPNKIPEYEDIMKLPNDQYTCTECPLVPEILKIDYEYNEIEIKCKNHGQKKLSIKDYFIESSNHSYYNYKCQNCNKSQKEFYIDISINYEENDLMINNSIFKYCYDCQNILCPDCSHKHSHNSEQHLLPVNLLNNKCRTHFEEDNFNIYCVTCAENICNNTRETDHSEHFIEVIPRLNPKEENINIIINKNNLIRKNIELLQYLYKINDTIITTYRVSKCNYFHNLNVGHLFDSIKKSFHNFEEGLKELFIKLNNRQRNQLLRINKKFNLKLTGNENKINLNNKNLTIQDLQVFYGLKMPYVEELSLQNNNINNINALDNFDIPNVKWINLSYNKIKDISSLKNISLRISKVEKINLKSNHIENIDILINDMFPHITEINIQNNEKINFETKIAKNIINKLDKILIYQLSDIEKQKDLLYLFNQRYENQYTFEEIEIDLSGKALAEEGLRLFSQIKFSKLQEVNLNYNNIKLINELVYANCPELRSLNLSNNNINDINMLSKLNFKKLEKLDLSSNNITELDIFENVDFPLLEELYLSSNNIKTIGVIGKFKFEKLKKLFLSNNKIVEINSLEDLNAPDLDELYLNINNINDIKVLKNVKFSKLHKLYLGQNNITDINVFEKVDFPKLKRLDLSKNYITDISVFSKTKFDDLQKLYLSENKIVDINVFGKVSFSQLQELYLNMNEIDNISVFERIKFYQLYGLYLSDNRIDYSFENNKNIIQKLKILVKDLNT